MHSESDAHSASGSDGGESTTTFHIVGVGASAGGLEALEQLFAEMPDDIGMAFVVVQHLSPDFKSHMRELLARKTALKVTTVEDQMPVAPNTIFLIPPKKEMIISGGKLLLSDKDPQAWNQPIDHFFTSLAHDAGPRAIGIVLSGTGSDGSQGIQDIHAAGGLVLCQTVETAKFDGMPINAQKTGVVDVTIAPAEVASTLARFTSESLQPGQLGQDSPIAGDDSAMGEILHLLQQEFRFDFGLYKEQTTLRRILRRMSLQNVATIEEYADRLRQEPAERDELCKDLLIGVTRFFRDREAFEQLEKLVIPGILSRVPLGETIRVWVAGCATGEEAYSIGILLDEALQRNQRPPDFKIFATDIYQASLKFAGLATYPKAALEEVTPARRDRYFRTKQNSFQVIAELREKIVFAPHNVISDAPFTQLDLVTCRNLLIYLQTPAQQRAVSLFHFGLKTGGILFLGPSESPGNIADEFEVVDKHWKIYRKRRDVRLPTDLRLPLQVAPASMPRAVLPPSPSQESTQKTHLLATYEHLLQQFMPAGFLVDDQLQLVHTFPGAERYLRFRSGPASTSLLDVLLDELKMPASGVLQHALRENKRAQLAGTIVRLEDREERVRLAVQPIPQIRKGASHVLLTIETIADPVSDRPVDSDLQVDEMNQERINALETELRYTRENLQATVEEVETANEELQATNEELVASNEELQSTNQELHSVNEELLTVNVELQEKIDQLTEANDDMDNLLATTRVGVIYVNSDLLIRRFTPEIARLFHLIPQDIGRSIDSFAHTIEHPELIENVKTVLATRQEIETHVRDRSGKNYLLRIVPYLSKNEPAGVVLTMIDVHALTSTQRQLSRFKFMSDNAKDTHGLIDQHGYFHYVNPAMCRSLEYDAEELLATPVTDVLADFDVTSFHSFFQRAAEEDIPTFESHLVSAGGRMIPVDVSLSSLSFEGERFLFLSTHDISERKRAERRLSAEHAVAKVLAEGQTLDAGLKQVVTRLCEELRAAAVEMWMPEPGGQRMKLAFLAANSERASAEQWRQHLQAERLQQQDRFPDLAWKEHEIAWFDVEKPRDAALPRKVLDEAQIQTALAFPVGDRETCYGLIVCWFDRRLHRRQELRPLLNSLSRLISQFIVRVETKKSLEASAERWERVTAASMDAIISIDDQGVVQRWNAQSEKIFGWSKAEALGRNLAEMIIPETQHDAHREGIERFLKTGDTRVINNRLELTALHRSGREIPVELTVSAYLVGDRFEFTGFVRDLMERKIAEAELWLHHRALEATHNGILITDATQEDNPIIYANSGFTRLTGYAPEEVVGRNCRLLQGPETSADAVQALHTAIENGQPCSVTLLNYRKDGASFWNNLTITPVRDEQNRLTHFVGIQNDISERIEVESKVRESEERIRVVLNSAAEGIYGIDTDGHCTFCNKAGAVMLGYSDAEELVGEHMHRCIHHSHADGTPHEEQDCQIYKAYRNAERIHVDDEVFWRKDGTSFPAEYWSFPVIRDDEIVGAVVTFLDITERVRNQEQLNAAQQQAEAANLAKSEFLANMSHEIRTPMTAVLGFTEMLLADLKESAHVERLQTIKRNGNYLLEIINDILDLSKIEAGKLLTEQTEVSLAVLLQDVAALMEERAKEKQLPLEIKSIGKVPEIIFSDRIRLRQILLNLIGNAIKFTDEGAISVTVRFIEEEKSELEICVADTGIGIAPENQRRLFQPFAQADSEVTQKFGGTGLGLSISQRLAQRLGGKITLKSELNQGSQFTLTIPTGDVSNATFIQIPSDDQADLPAEDSPSESPAAAGGALHDRRILVADDRRDVWKVAQFFLEKAGADVTIAGNGREAIEAVQRASQEERPVDLILMDMQMPEMDGFQATKHLRDDGFDRPIVALTAGAMIGEREQCLEAGCTDYCTKPIDGTMLVRTVCRHLNILPDDNADENA